MRRRVLLAAALALSCSAAPPSRTPDPPRSSFLALGPNVYCGATRVGPATAVTARHCVDDLICGTATDVNGVSVRCTVQSLDPSRDLAYLTLAPGSTAGIAEVGEYIPGPATRFSTKPVLAAQSAVGDSRPRSAPLVMLSHLGRPTALPAESLFQFEGLCVPGESGSGVFQRGRLVGVLSASNLRDLCVATSVQ